MCVIIDAIIKTFKKLEKVTLLVRQRLRHQYICVGVSKALSVLIVFTYLDRAKTKLPGTF